MLGVILRIVFLGALVKILLETEKPFLCSGIYAFIGFLFRLIVGIPLLNTLISTAISFALASLYFWLLNRFSESGWLFWLILIFGLAIGIV